jgi:hypothetical protein
MNCRIDCRYLTGLDIPNSYNTLIVTACDNIF